MSEARKDQPVVLTHASVAGPIIAGAVAWWWGSKMGPLHDSIAGSAAQQTEARTGRYFGMGPTTQLFLGTTVSSLLFGVVITSGVKVIGSASEQALQTKDLVDFWDTLVVAVPVFAASYLVHHFRGRGR